MYADFNNPVFEDNIKSYLYISKNLQKYMKTKIIKTYKDSPKSQDMIDFYNKFNTLLLPITQVLYNTPQLKDTIILNWNIKTGKNNDPNDNNVFEYMKLIVNRMMKDLIYVVKQLDAEIDPDTEDKYSKQYLKLTQNIKNLINDNLMFDRETMMLINELINVDDNPYPYIDESYIDNDDYQELIKKVITINNCRIILTLLYKNKTNNDTIKTLLETQTEQTYIEVLNQAIISQIETFTQKINSMDNEYKQQRDILKQQYIDKKSISEDEFEDVQEDGQGDGQEDGQEDVQDEMKDIEIMEKHPSSKKRKIYETDIKGGGKNKELYKKLLNNKLINLG